MRVAQERIDVQRDDLADALDLAVSSATNASVSFAAHAARSADSLPYFCAIGFASTLPTFVMPSAESRRENVALSFAVAIAVDQVLRATVLPNRSSPSSCSTVSVEQIGDVLDQLRLDELTHDLLAEPVDVQLVARREELDRAEQLRRATEPVRAHQRDATLLALERGRRTPGTPSVARTRVPGPSRVTSRISRDDLAGLLDAARDRPCRGRAARPDPSCGRDARDTVVPETSTGSRIATGVTAPVRPMLTSMSRSIVVTWRAGNLYAIAQRGNFAVVPSAPRCAKSSTLIDEAVELVGERVALVLPARARTRSARPSSSRRVLCAFVGRPSRLMQLERGEVAGGVALAVDDLVQDRPHRPLRDLARILLLDRAGRGVARVLEQLLAGFRARLVDRRELGLASCRSRRAR